MACSGRLITRFGARPVLLAGQLLLVLGLLLLTRSPGGGYLVDLLPAFLLLGLGAGLALPAVTTAIMSDAGPADAGLVSGLANTSQQVGGALGVAVLASLAAARTEAALSTGAPAAVALQDGYQLAFAVGAALVAASAVVTTGLPDRALPPTRVPAGAL